MAPISPSRGARTPSRTPARTASTAPRCAPRRTRLAELIARRAAARAGHHFIEAAEGERFVDYAALQLATDRWSALLDDLGVPDGATVGLVVSDPLDFALAFLGTMAAGRVAGPIDPRATDYELVAAWGRLGAVLVVADRPAPTASSGEWLTLPPRTFGLDDGVDGAVDGGVDGGVDGALDGSSAIAAAVPGGGPPGGGPDSAAPGAGLVLCTSGTTGAPKRVRLDEDQLLHTAAAVASHHRLGVVDRGFNPLPLFHINGEVVGLLATLTAGGTLVLVDRFHRTGFWAAMARHRVTWINAVPAILARLVPLAGGESVPPGIRFARSASAPLPLAVLGRFEQATGIPVVETYGMTEAGSQIAANPVDGPRRPGSVGRPVSTDVEVRAAPGSVGPVHIRGRGVITAFDGPGYEDRFDGDGWLDTGDVGYFEDGWLYLVGRADDVINCGGEKVHPREVEEILLGDEETVACAVVGIDQHELGQVPAAYVVPAWPASPGDDRAEALVRRLEERCGRLLSKPKRPAAYHVVARLPEGVNGKLRRSAVAAETPIYSLLVR